MPSPFGNSNNIDVMNKLLYGDAPLNPQTYEEHLRALRPRYANFVRNVVAGQTQIDAYLNAGFKASRNSAQTTSSTLLNRPEVAAAIKQGRVEAAKESKYELEELVAELNDVAQFARDTKNATAYARAVELKAKVLGLLVERSQVNVNQTVDLTGLLLDGYERVKSLGPAEIVTDVLPEPAEQIAHEA